MLTPQSLALAYALSTVAGLRSSLTVLALSIAVHVHVIAAPASLTWLGSDITLGIATIFALADTFADKIPLVDNALHFIHMILAPLVGGVAVFTVAHDPASAGALAPLGAPAAPVAGYAIAGGALALAVNALRGTIRAASSTFSLGMLNPVVSVGEDVSALVVLAVAFIAPYAAAIALFALTVAAVIAAVVVVRAVSRRRRATATA